MVENTAPGALEKIRLFVNTRNIEEGTDAIDSPASLGAWLAEHGLLAAGTRVTSGDVARARGVREAFRTLLLANNGDNADAAAATQVLNDVAKEGRFSLTFRPGSTARVEPHAPGVKGALGALLSIGADSMADGSWWRLKACASDECLWAFYDHARNRSGKWCEMAVCGNRMKARTYRTRHA